MSIDIRLSIECDQAARQFNLERLGACGVPSMLLSEEAKQQEELQKRFQKFHYASVRKWTTARRFRTEGTAVRFATPRVEGDRRRAAALHGHPQAGARVDRRAGAHPDVSYLRRLELTSNSS